MHAIIATMNPNTEAATIAPTTLPTLMLTVFDAAMRKVNINSVVCHYCQNYWIT